MKHISILKHNLMRAAMTLALIVTCAAAWAQTTVSYIDADGNPQSHEAIVLTGSETTLGTPGQTTWYVVNSDIAHSGSIDCISNVNIILADGKTMTVNGGNNSAFLIQNTLTIYGQSGQSGILNASTSISNEMSGAIYSNDGSFIVNGGTINVTCSTMSGKGIYTKYLTINGGTAACSRQAVSFSCSPILRSFSG